ncbi:MAG: hypoxanthine phosphoribosyltransferase [Oscillospiraceae bacterium]|nr:hypoxanthine phosphoribosyltransferase [Oscillospiraceae bacterium]
MNNDIESVLLDEAEIASIVKDLGKKISEDYKDKNLLLVCVLKGSVCFMADLMRAIDIPCHIDFVSSKSYGSTTVSNNAPDIKAKFTYEDISQFDILLVEDIFDSGRTLQEMTKLIRAVGPRSLACCSLLDKPDRRDKNVTMELDYVGKQIPNAFVVGYGLDFNEKYRNLPYVGILKECVYK